ncbi:MAG TPA: YciI family protein [Trebonia sp.]
MKYMLLLYGPELPAPGTEEAATMLAEWTAARQAMAEAGVLIDCAPLQPTAASTTVQVRGGETLLTDGPAAEIKEVFGGFTLIECDGLDDALKWAARLPTAHDGKVEVRPVVQVAAPGADS